jgi:hypothetical protein
LAVAIVLLGPSTAVGAPVGQSDPRYFSETGFRIGNDKFWDYFQKRGGVRTFGFPVSRDVAFQGFTVQFFQRAVMQLAGDSVQTMNLLDEGLLPYTTINGSTFPAPDQDIKKATPSASDLGKMIEFVRQNAPDTWEGKPVNFFKTFSSTVSLSDAFPRGGGSSALLPAFNLEIWGAPTSAPTKDPNNHNFVYLRFQRGIMHYDDACKCTQGLLLADYLKALLTGENLPADLAAQASGSPLYLALSKDTDAFAKQQPGETSSVAAGPPGGDRQPAVISQPASPPRSNSQSSSGSSSSQRSSSRQRASSGGPLYRASSPEYGMNVFLWGNPATTDRDLKKLRDAGFTWQKSLFQWREIEPAKGQFKWDEADRIVVDSRKAGVKIIARIDFQPRWARQDNPHNGPPDNYEDYANFIYAFVSRYSSESDLGQVQAIEIWNEPTLDREWGNAPINQAQASDYVRLLKIAYEAAKGADPSVVVITGGLSPTCTDNNNARPDDVYLQWMYDAGAKPYFDVLGAHGAGYDKPPSASMEESAQKHSGCRVFTFRRVEDLRQVMVANGDADKQVWLLEFGWTTDKVHPAYAWHAISEQQHADYLVGSYQWAAKNWAPWIGVMTLWNLPDPGWGPDREEYWWAVANPDGSSRPAYDRLLKARQDGTLP